MFVKVTRGRGMAGDFLIEVEGPITSGSMVIPFDPKDDDPDIIGALGRELVRDTWGDGEASSEDDIPTMTWTHTHLLAIDNFVWQDGEVKGAGSYWLSEDTDGGNLIVKYAWWHTDDGTVCVITTRNIFILGDTGKTIDRVR